MGNIQDLNSPYFEAWVTWVFGVLLGSIGMLFTYGLHLTKGFGIGTFRTDRADIAQVCSTSSL
jgi:hypothetical protein